MKFPITLTINNQAELNELEQALMNAHDMKDDMMLENIPFRPSEIHALAGKNDEDLQIDLRELRRDTGNNINEVINIMRLQIALSLAMENNQ